MTKVKVTIESGMDLDKFEEATLDYIHRKYHTHQTFIRGSGKVPHNEYGSDTSIPKWMTNPGKDVG